MHRAATPKTKRRPPSAQDATHSNEVTAFKRTERQRESKRTIRKARVNGSELVLDVHVQQSCLPLVTMVFRRTPPESVLRVFVRAHDFIDVQHVR